VNSRRKKRKCSKKRNEIVKMAVRKIGICCMFSKKNMQKVEFAKQRLHVFPKKHKKMEFEKKSFL